LAFTASGRYNYTKVNLVDNWYLGGHKEATCILDSDGTVDDCGGAGGLTAGAGQTLVSTAGGNAGGNHVFKRFNPAVGVAYAFTPEFNTYAGYNEGSRAPSPIETGCADPAYPCLLPNAMAGDPPLQQVVTKTFEGGMRGKLGADTRWSLGAYRAVNHNDLQFIASSSTGAGYFDNVGKTRRQGFDLALNSKVGNFSWAAGYSLIDATYQDTFNMASQANSSRVNGEITVSKGNKMAGIAKHQFKLRGQLQATPNWSIGTTGVAFSDQYARGNENNQHQADNTTYFGSGKVKGYAVFNLDSRYDFNASGWQLFAKVNNVFDRKYYSSGLLGENAFVDNSEFDAGNNSKKELFLAPGAPRAAWVGVRYDFGKPKGAAANVDAD